MVASCCCFVPWNIVMLTYTTLCAINTEGETFARHIFIPFQQVAQDLIKVMHLQISNLEHSIDGEP